MITITYEKFMAALALFTALCVSGGWLIKIIKGLKKPSDDVANKLSNDNQRITKLRNDVDRIEESLQLLLKSNFFILGHLQTGNNTGEMARMEKEIQDFLIKN